MNVQSMMQLAQKLLPPELWSWALKAAGAVALMDRLVPALATWGVPAAVRAADWLANLVLESPLKPLAMWQAQNIVSFLDALTLALEKVEDTFRLRLEADLKAAQAQQQPQQKQ